MSQIIIKTNRTTWFYREEDVTLTMYSEHYRERSPV